MPMCDGRYNFMNKELCKHIKEFHPIAYYDSEYDSICIQIKDCSFTEVVINDFITLYRSNHVPDIEYIGIEIKRASEVLFGMNTSGSIIEILDGVIKKYPKEFINCVRRYFRV